jgi:hypothetical protein
MNCRASGLHACGKITGTYHLCHRIFNLDHLWVTEYSNLATKPTWRERRSLNCRELQPALFRGLHLICVYHAMCEPCLFCCVQMLGVYVLG